MHGIRQAVQDTRVRFAHFSVKEYIESDRIMESRAKDFYLENAKEQEFLAQSCLTYLLHYSNSNDKSSTSHDLVIFPLLKYAARSWFYHASLQQSGKVGQELCLLNSESTKLDWLRVYQPDRPQTNWDDDLEDTGSNVYYCQLYGI